MPGPDVPVTPSAPANDAPSGAPGYVDKYAASIVRDLQTTVAAIDAIYHTEIRIRPERILTV